MTDAATTIVFDTEIFDINANYIHTTGIFTAPVDGKYLFGCNLRLEDINTTCDFIWVYFITTRGTYRRNLKRYDAMGFSTQVNYWMSSDTILADMDLGDTCYIQTDSSNAGSGYYDIYGSTTTANQRDTHFWGYLLG